ncbi:SDR family NAD(P)-dependent oxidoreductase, partial [Rhizobium sp. 9T]
GGASGIGKAVCERFSAEGARVVVADLDGERCARVAEAIGPGAWGVALDVTSQDSIEEATRFSIATAGQIDILVNAAGIYEVESILEISRERTARVFQVNIEGVIFMTQAVARHMVERGEGGRIINFSSQA